MTDNRTGKQYEIKLENNAASASELIEIKNSQGVATKCLDTNFSNTVICKSDITFIEDGNAEYRGIQIK